jgi:hypothetical protein
MWIVRFEGFTAVATKNAVFWDVAPCRSCVNRRFGGTYRLHLHGRKLLTLVILPWRWRRYVLPKRRFTQDLHDSTSHKTIFFIIYFNIIFWVSLLSFLPWRIWPIVLPLFNCVVLTTPALIILYSPVSNITSHGTRKPGFDHQQNKHFLFEFTSISLSDIGIQNVYYKVLFFIIASGMGLSPLYCGHFWPIVPAPDDRWGWLWSNWWNEDW